MEKFLNVSLVSHTADSEKIVALAAKTCYSKSELTALREAVNSKDQTAFVRKVMGMGHDAILEHATFTFAIEGVSRVLLAQITRHRLASFCVQSMRYCSSANDLGYIVPPNIKALGAEYEQKYQAQMSQMHQWYQEWQSILAENYGQGETANEDARFVLPNAAATQMVVTMNARELRHFFAMRMCNRAQWEIRALAVEMHRLCMEVSPVLFADAGPGCVRGACPEGDKCCGHPYPQQKV